MFKGNSVVNDLITLGRWWFYVVLSYFFYFAIVSLPPHKEPLSSWLLESITFGLVLYTIITTSSPYNLSKLLLPMDIIAPIAMGVMMLIVFVGYHHLLPRDFMSFPEVILPYYFIWLLKYYYIRRFSHDQSSDVESPIQSPPDKQKIMREAMNTLITLNKVMLGFVIFFTVFAMAYFGTTSLLLLLLVAIFGLMVYTITTTTSPYLSKWSLPMDIIAPVAFAPILLMFCKWEASPDDRFVSSFIVCVIPYYSIWLLKYYYIRRFSHDQSSDVESPIQPPPDKQ